jgi:hypothetical protein
MKKIKISLTVLGLLLGVGGAVAKNYCFDCENSQQYFWNGQAFVATGVYGVNYACFNSAGTCTYTFEGTGYVPCRKGTYIPL